MAKLLIEGLGAADQMFLASLSSQEGYIVLKKIFEAQCDEVNKNLVKLNPADPNYDSTLKSLHIGARVINEFCCNVIASIEWHKQSYIAREQNEDEADKLVKLAKEETT